MPRLTRIFTRTGDDGSTADGTGRRLPKDSPAMEALGAIDELNALIGLALAAGVGDEIRSMLGSIQNDLFHLGSDLCVPQDEKPQRPVPRIEDRHVEALERWMDRLNEQLGPLDNFILPGGNESAARLHLARCVCRRAERLVVALRRTESVSAAVLKYLNRLSDALFVMARFENQRAGVGETLWKSRA